MGGIGFEFPGNQVTNHDSPRFSIDDDQIEHLPAGIDFDLPLGYLAHKRAVGADQQLLTGLPLCIKGPCHLCAAKGPVVQKAAVVPGKGNALGDALVDDILAQLGQPVYIGLPGPEVTPLDGVVKQPPGGIPVVRIILRRIDSPLGGDAVGPPGAVLDAKILDVIAQFTKACSSRCPGKPGADHDNIVLLPIGRIDQLERKAVPVPFFSQRSFRHIRIRQHKFPPLLISWLPLWAKYNAAQVIIPM